MRGKGVWNDPEWERLRKRVNGTHPQQASGQANKQQTLKDSANASKDSPKPQEGSDTPKKVDVTLSLSLPRIKKIKLTKKHKKIAVGLTSIAILTSAGFISNKLISNSKTDDTKDVLSETVTEPEFDTVLPDGKKEETDENKVGYDPQKKVASFRDTIGNVPITVSEQPLPEAFKSNPDEEVKKLAEGFSANQVISESNPKAYLGNDVAGAQTVIFHKNNLLIFILSAKPIEKDQWAEYITKLL